MKKDKTYYGFLFTIVVLFILLGISIYLGMSGWFYSISSTDADIDLMLGKKVVVAVEPNQTSAVSFGLKGEYIPHEKLTQTIKINAENVSDLGSGQSYAPYIFDGISGNLIVQVVENSNTYTLINELYNDSENITIETF